MAQMALNLKREMIQLARSNYMGSKKHRSSKKKGKSDGFIYKSTLSGLWMVDSKTGPSYIKLQEIGSYWQI